MTALAEDPKPVYQNDFQAVEIGKCPDEFLVLDGMFTVQQEGGNKFLELPGAPLDSYGVLFGPTENGDAVAGARIYATAKGRRVPTFALGLNGVGGYRIQISPEKKVLELYRGDTLKTNVPFSWESGQWTHLRVQVRKASSGWEIQGKAWTEGKAEPGSWNITAQDTEDLPAGRAGIFASPFSGTPIRFDDLIVTKLQR